MKLSAKSTSLAVPHRIGLLLPCRPIRSHEPKVDLYPRAWTFVKGAAVWYILMADHCITDIQQDQRCEGGYTPANDLSEKKKGVESAVAAGLKGLSLRDLCIGLP